jgi:uncharacterized protein (UPF0333 family)
MYLGQPQGDDDGFAGVSLRAQISAEFLLVIAALVSIFLVFYTIALEHNMNLFHVTDNINGRAEAYGLSTAMNYVHLAGDGTEYNFTARRNMTITNVSVQAGSGRAPLLNKNTNTSTVGIGSAIIRNNDGEIEIEQ